MFQVVVSIFTPEMAGGWMGWDGTGWQWMKKALAFRTEGGEVGGGEAVFFFRQNFLPFIVTFFIIYLFIILILILIIRHHRLENPPSLPNAPL